MKKWMIFAIGAVLSACAQSPQIEPIGEVGMPNPASGFCQEKGGQVVVRQDKNGNEYGVCVFADGAEMEEWAYFYRHQP